MQGNQTSLVAGQMYSAANYEGLPLRYTILKVYEDVPTFKAKQEVACMSGGVKPLPQGCPNDFYTTSQCWRCVSQLIRHKPWRSMPKLMVDYRLDKCVDGVWQHVHNLNYPALKFFKPSLPKKTLMEIA